MKQFLIVKRAKEWQILIEGRKCGILRCEDRAPLVQTACKIAVQVDGAVNVYDIHNKLEARLTFQAGALAVDGHYEDELQLEQPSTVGA